VFGFCGVARDPTQGRSVIIRLRTLKRTGRVVRMSSKVNFQHEKIMILLSDSAKPK